MSENYGGNNYDAYFKQLEENLEKSRLSQENNNNTNSVQSGKTTGKNRIRKKYRLRKSALAALIFIIAIIIGAGVLVGALSYKSNSPKISGKTDNSATESVEKKTDRIAKTVYKFGNSTKDIPATNDAQYAIVIDKSTNTVIAARNATERAFPASTTKIMTLLVAVELITDYSDTFTLTLDITDPLFVEGASVAGFLNGESVSMTDLLYGTILPSGADAAMALAVKLAGSEEEFVKLMNRKVAELGLENTHFDNVTGLHSLNNYSTAYDMAIILDTALQNELCKKVLSTYQYTTAKNQYHPEGILLSSTLFTYMYGTEPETATILGGKTGYVNESGYCIASYGRNNENGNEYIVVTLSNSAKMPAFFGQIDLYKEFAK